MLRRAKRSGILSQIGWLDSLACTSMDGSTDHAINDRFSAETSTSFSIPRGIPSRSFASSSSRSSNSVGLCMIHGLDQPNDWKKLAAQTRRESESIVQQIKTSPPSARVIRLMDDLSDTLCRLLDPAQLVAACHVDASWRNAAHAVLIDLGDYVHDLNVDPAIYHSIKRSIDKFEGASEEQRRTDPALRDYSEETVRVGKMLLRDCERSGVHLDEAGRVRVARLTNSIRTLELDFLRTCSDPTESGYLHLDHRHAEVEQLPPSIRMSVVNPAANKSPSRHKGIRAALSAALGSPAQSPSSSTDPLLPLDTSTLWAVLHDVPSRALRERVYRAGMQQPKRNLDTMLQLTEQRLQLAHMVGYRSYAEHQAGYGTVAGHPSAARVFVERMGTAARPALLREFQSLEHIKGRFGLAKTELKWWDVYYLLARAEDKNDAKYEAAYTEYLHVDRCLDGLSLLTSQLMGIQLRRATPARGEAWSPNLIKLTAEHETQGVVGTVYLDLLAREHKHANAATFMIRCGRSLHDGPSDPTSTAPYQQPIVALVCNFGSEFLTLQDFSTLLHEFGHTLHALLSRTHYQHVSGTRGPPDFTEVPSHLFERLASSPEFLRLVGRHRFTKEPIPEPLLRKASLSRQSFAAMALQDQVVHSLVDLELYGERPPTDETELQHAVSVVHDAFQPIPIEPGAKPHLRFTHLVGYGGQYYSYLYARCLADALWHEHLGKAAEALVPSGSASRDTARAEGELIRSRLLAPGGAVPPQDLTRSLLGDAALEQVDRGYAPSRTIVERYLAGRI